MIGWPIYKLHQSEGVSVLIRIYFVKNEIKQRVGIFILINRNNKQINAWIISKVKDKLYK